jgi:antitoxin FitA
MMAQLLIRNVPDEVKAAIKRRAALKGVSMEAEARAILESALANDPKARPKEGLGTRTAALFAGIGFKEGEFQRVDSEFKVINFDDPDS